MSIFIGDILDKALARTLSVRGGQFQPMSYFEHYGNAPNGGGRITLTEVMRTVETQIGGRFGMAHPGPPGCEKERYIFLHNFCASLKR